MKNLSILLCIFALNATLSVFGQDKKTVSIEMSGEYATRASIRLAPKRFFSVEFPVGDEVLTSLSSDDDLIRGDEAFVEKNDSTIPLVYRAEKSWGGNEKESVTIMIMMKSGAVLSLEVFPAAGVSESNDRVLWKYEPLKIASLRTKTLAQPSALNNKKAADSATTVDDLIATDQTAPILVSSKSDADSLLTGERNDDLPQPPFSTDHEAGLLAREMLAGMENANLSSFPKSKSLADNPDLLIAALSSQWAKNGTWTVSVVGVQNKSKNSVQLIDYPQLRVSTKADKGQTLDSKSIIPLGVAASTDKFPVILQPNEVVFFAYVFTTPFLGSTQTLQVLASHSNLSDKPAIISVRPGGIR